MATHSSILAWEFHGQRVLVGYSPRGCKESDTTESKCTTKRARNRMKKGTRFLYLLKSNNQGRPAQTRWPPEEARPPPWEENRQSLKGVCDP